MVPFLATPCLLGGKERAGAITLDPSSVMPYELRALTCTFRGEADYAKKARKVSLAIHVGVSARQKLPLGSTQSPATQVTHARRDSAQF